MSDPQPDPTAPGLAIALPEDKRAGVWANFALVSHSPYEFTLDFARLEFDGEKPMGGIVVQRVSVSPLFVTQLIEALTDNWNKYAFKAMPKEVTTDDQDVGPASNDDGDDDAPDQRAG